MLRLLSTMGHTPSVMNLCLTLSCILVMAWAGWVDPDTEEAHLYTKSRVDDRRYKLVFSDEFNVEGRDFTDGHDPRWTSIHKDDYTNFALHYYNSNLAKTSGGALNISTIIEDITFRIDSPEKAGVKHVTKNFQSGMIQGWNKFCFTGGIIEISAQLPGKYDIAGLWPAMWLLGNLARATFVGSSNNMWPWSYDVCNHDLQHEQAISACNAVNHFGMHAYKGRGAPEIDILEAMAGKMPLPNTKIHRPYFSTSLQIAPGLMVDDYRPEVASKPATGFWYDNGIEYISNETDLNIFFYGMHLEGSTKAQSYIADAISANTNLYETHFTEYHKYRLEWSPGYGGYLKWYLDDDYLYSISSTALNKTGGLLPEEPMYLLLNTAVSSTWGFPMPCPEGCPCDCFDPRKQECECALPSRMIDGFPAHFLVDYVRVYQAEGDSNQTVGCSTTTHPTSSFIKGHPEKYMEEGAKQPLKPIQKGGMRCVSHADCGGGLSIIDGIGGRGSCEKGVCKCSPAYTGPRCMASEGFDDFKWEVEVPLNPVLMMIPAALRFLVVAIVLFLAGVVFAKYRFDKESRSLAFLQGMPQQSMYAALPTGEGEEERGLSSTRPQFQSGPSTSYQGTRN